MERYRISANTPKPPLPSSFSLSRRIDDAEISIFDAERYFNQRDDILVNTLKINKNFDVSTNPRDSSVSSVVSSVDGYARNLRARSFRAMPTASSEASWNSQTGLLANPPGSAGVTVKTFPDNKKGWRFFPRHCPCSGKKSVSVQEKFSPKSVKSDDHSEPLKVKIQAKEPPGFGFTFPPPPRESLEVFNNLRIVPNNVEDDMCSEASSDLFELESFASAVYRRRDSIDELPKITTATVGMLQFRRSLEELSVAPSECYAPSEVSVEWSVTTAEGGFDRASLANFSSAASDYGEKESAVVKKRGGGGLLSCRCEKAISVGPDPVRFVPEQRPAPAVVPSRLAR